jgi:hypothetical protein
MAMELNPVQLFVIASVASVIVYLLKLAKVTQKPAWLTVLVYVASLVLALIWARPTLPPLPPFTDISVFVPALLAWIVAAMVPLSAFVGFATLIYNVLLKAVLDKWVTPFLKRHIPSLK